MSESLVDWRLARRVAAGVAGSPEGAERPAAALRPESLTASCARAEELVRGYARLDPATAIPGPEAIGRREWSEAVLGTLRELAMEIEHTRPIGDALQMLGIPCHIIPRDMLDKRQIQPGQEGEWEWRISGTGKAIAVKTPVADWRRLE